MCGIVRTKPKLAPDAVTIRLFGPGEIDIDTAKGRHHFDIWEAKTPAHRERGTKIAITTEYYVRSAGRTLDGHSPLAAREVVVRGSPFEP